ncbi:MAG TPA: hypothetical protein VMT68_08410 [Caulobacteraceae bacterium]|nr:hypothetical protein [Caulobacteraceae bacterium]
MPWVSRFTRYGDMHWVFGQEQNISCGVACVIMAAYKVNKLTPGVRAEFTEADVLARATTLFGPNPLGTGGLNNPQMAQLLNDPMFNMAGWTLSTLPQTAVPGRITNVVGVTSGFGPTLNVNPIILGIDWNGGGGHWVLVDTIRVSPWDDQRYATVCDPWDANVHLTPLTANQTFAYTGHRVWGITTERTYDYQAPSTGGVFVGDVINR